MKYILVIALILSSFSINAQMETSTEIDKKEVIVELQNGTTIEGHVNEWKIGEFLDLKTAWVGSMTIPSASIKKVTQKSTLEPVSLSLYNFKETGKYFTTKVQVITGNDGNRSNGKHGLGLSISGGKRFHRLASLGFGMGYDVLISDTGERVLPLFLEYSSYFTPKNVSTFFNIQAGYSLAFKDTERRIIDAKGGFMVYPSFGLRFGEDETKCTVDIGYKFQRAEFTYVNGSDWHEQRLVYRRLTLRFGILI